ncbi:MAG: TldD/PmbA family protein [Acidimicrobiales bacterium]|nr:TldD/PmbA family protein [Acidimicrobiales bacterium]
MSELLGVAEQIVGWANGTEQVEAYVARGNRTSVKVYGSEIESFSSAQYEGAGIRVIVDGRQGFAYAGSLDVEVLQDTLREARDNAGFAEPDEFVALAEPDGVPFPDIDLFNPSLLEVTPEAKIDLAFALEKALLGADPRIKNVLAAMYGDGWGEMALASTTGIRAWDQENNAALQTQCLAVDNGDTQTGFGFSLARSFDELDLDKVVDDAVRRATQLLGATKPKSKRVAVILDPLVTSSFLGVIDDPLCGDQVAKGRSFFANRVGETVASPLVTLVSDPTNTASLAADKSDGEGLASRRVPLIDKGVLTGFAHNTYSARRSGTTSTASAVRGLKSTPVVSCRALAIEPGTKSQAQLMAELGEGVLITSVSGLHSGVNPVSGDFSTGADGLMFRDGQIAEPVREFTIASTMQRMLSDVVAVGNDIENLPSGLSMSVAIGDVSVSGS